MSIQIIAQGKTCSYDSDFYKFFHKRTLNKDIRTFLAPILMNKLFKKITFEKVIHYLLMNRAYRRIRVNLKISEKKVNEAR